MLIEDHLQALCIILKHLNVFYPILNLVFNVFSLNDSVPITDPMWFLPWSVILILSLKSFCVDCVKLLFFIMRMMVFAGFGQYITEYPKSGPLWAFRYSHHFLTPDCRAIVRISYLFHFIICNFIV